MFSRLPAHTLRASASACAGVLLLAACAPADPPADNATAPPAAANTANTATLLTDPGGGQCGGRDVRITRDGFRLVFDDACGAIVIIASHGALNVEQARSIRVEGNDVTVLNSDVETVEVTGSNNRLNLTRVGSALIEGNGNGLLGEEYGTVTFRGHDNYVNCDNRPTVEDTGTGNRVL